MTRILAILFYLLYTSPCLWAQPDYELSTSLGLDEVGINKVLCMQNGNTILFHFQIGKPIRVMVFDSTHKRIANNSQSCRELDLFATTTSVFKGLYEVGGEAVLFVEQQNAGRNSLIMLRFNGRTGRLIDEKVVGKSKSMAKPSQFFVMRYKGEPGYKILYSQEVMQFKQSRVHVSYYNEKHEIYRDVPLNFDRDKYDFMSVVGAECAPEGVCVALSLSTMLVNGTRANPIAVTNPVYQHNLRVFYISEDSTRPLQRNVDLSTDIIPYYTHFTTNHFARSINVLLETFREGFYRYGIEMRPTSDYSSLFFAFDPSTLDGTYNWVTNKQGNAEVLARTDTNYAFRGLPLRMFTNSHGLTTVVSESYDRNMSTESFARMRVHESYFGNLCVTRLNDEGDELWGTVLPKSQFYKSYRQFYNPADLAKRWQQHAMFNDMPEQVYERQFVSANCYTSGSDLYVVYNDCNDNIIKGLDKTIDTMYVSALSNACVYRIDKKNNVTKKYLYGEPLPREYKSSFIEGADFDDKRKVYASVMRYKRGEFVTLRLAWAQLY
jgi:hypothetical protein